MIKNWKSKQQLLKENARVQKETKENYHSMKSHNWNEAFNAFKYKSRKHRTKNPAFIQLDGSQNST